MTAATPTKTKTSVATKPQTLGELIDNMWALREERTAAEAVVDGIKAKIAAVEAQIDERMEAEGMTKATGAKATVSFTFTTIADVQGDEGWTKLYAYIKKTGYWHLLHRRVTDAAYKELLEAGKKVPGVEPFTKKRINLRTIPS